MRAWDPKGLSFVGFPIVDFLIKNLKIILFLIQVRSWADTLGF